MSPQPYPLRQTARTAQRLGRSLIYDQTADLVYLNNPKAACSTIKATFMRGLAARRGITLEGAALTAHVHGKSDLRSDHFHRITPGRTRVFTVVRNPYTRILSAYLDKIVRPDPGNITRRRMALQFGLAPDDTPDLARFLRMIAQPGRLLDPHFAPQVANTLPAAFGAEVHAFENLPNLAPMLSDLMGAPIQTRQRHATGAAPEALTDEAAELIATLYAEDFDTFGYSRDPARRLLPPAEPVQIAQDDDKTTLRCITWLGRMNANEAPPDMSEADERAMSLPERALFFARRWHRALPLGAALLDDLPPPDQPDPGGTVEPQLLSALCHLRHARRSGDTETEARLVPILERITGTPRVTPTT